MREKLVSTIFLGLRWLKLIQCPLMPFATSNQSNDKSATFLIQGADLRGVHFVGTDLQRADFQRADLREVVFMETDLSQALLYDADLYRTDFRLAEGITPEQVKKAKNWDKALYAPDFSKELGIPSNIRPEDMITITSPEDWTDISSEEQK